MTFFTKKNVIRMIKTKKMLTKKRIIMKKSVINGNI